ncbi:MAG: phosphate ABC transporter substrate-binding protein PstS [Burkholderiaceae bacterium]|nr:phosphate ABC transporter substrate-binding protein PstS [Burkholderiaceae bacterium]
MLKRLVFWSFALVSAPAFASDITGAGSTAAAPLYSKWGDAYTRKTGIKLAYDAIGSSGGIQKIKESAVAFGASDAPMADAELKAANLLAFPTVISGVVPFVNLPGVRPGELRLTGDIVAGIYSGAIVKWNDPAIVAENPSLALPNRPIVSYGRLDGSGTTFTLTDYLSRISPEWKARYGRNFKIAWPANVVAIKGTNDIVAAIKKTPGSIGYAEYAYVIENDLGYVQLKNRDGNYVKPNAASFRAALSKSSWEKTGNFEEMLTDKPGAGSWPITGSTYVYVPRVTSQPQRTAAALQFFTWAFMEGDTIANSLDYIRLPDTVQGRVFHEISSVVDDQQRRLALSINLK